MMPLGTGSWFVSAAVACLTAAWANGAEPGATIADVKKAWQTRQDAAKAFRIEWIEKARVKAGSYDFLFELGKTEVPGPHPPEDYEGTTSFSQSADGEKVATTVEGAGYSHSRKTWGPSLFADYFDGRTVTTIDPLARPGWGKFKSVKGKDAADFAYYTPVWSAIAHVYRPVGSGASAAFDLKNAKLSDRAEKIGGVTCVKLDVEVQGVRHSLWCDPARGYLPIRSKQVDAGHVTELEWRYREDATGAAVLAGWTYRDLFADPTDTREFVAEVKRLDLAPKFAAGAFAPKPTPSSHVIIREGGVEKDEYLLRPDGSKRPLKASERDKSFDELIKTNADGTPYVPAKP